MISERGREERGGQPTKQRLKKTRKGEKRTNIKERERGGGTKRKGGKQKRGRHGWHAPFTNILTRTNIKEKKEGTTMDGTHPLQTY